MTYRFRMVCPRCDHETGTDRETYVPEPHLNCGECLMEYMEIVPLKVAAVTQIETEDEIE